MMPKVSKQGSCPSHIFTVEDKYHASKQRESKQADRLEDVSKRGQEDLSHSWHGSACKSRGQRTS